MTGVGSDKAECWAVTESLWLEGQGPKQNCFSRRPDATLGKVGGTESEKEVQETQDQFERFQACTELLEGLGDKETQK